jgi:hypothetical protein
VLPIERWAHGPALKRIERLASRWSAGAHVG